MVIQDRLRAESSTVICSLDTEVLGEGEKRGKDPEACGMMCLFLFAFVMKNHIGTFQALTTVKRLI